MEHLIDFDFFKNETEINSLEKYKKLVVYSRSILYENKAYNLTGHKTFEQIFSDLIVGSLKPLVHINVPRGTLFADLGTGAGIPGIPVAVKYPDANGVLFDSVGKKTGFVERFAGEAGIGNISVRCMRIEDAGRDAVFRGTFDMVFSRAMSDIFTLAELGAPLLKKGGRLFLYLKESQLVGIERFGEHFSALGLEVEGVAAEKFQGVLVMLKSGETGERYPRRMAVIRRAAVK